MSPKAKKTNTNKAITFHPKHHIIPIKRPNVSYPDTETPLAKKTKEAMKAWKNYCISILPAILACSILSNNASLSNGEYLIGVGSYDMTGPAANVNMMGYANIDQVSSGIHFRLRARAFIIAESQNGRRLAFVNLDAGMASQLVTIKVLERLGSRYGDLYNEDNIAISGTHTHAGPGGYLQYVLYAATSLGFVKQSFDVIVNAIEQSIVQAHGNLKPGSILINKGRGSE